MGFFNTVDLAISMEVRQTIKDTHHCGMQTTDGCSYFFFFNKIISNGVYLYLAILLNFKNTLKLRENIHTGCHGQTETSKSTVCDFLPFDMYLMWPWNFDTFQNPIYRIFKTQFKIAKKADKLPATHERDNSDNCWALLFFKLSTALLLGLTSLTPATLR